MIVTLAFLLVIVAIAGWWLARQRIGARPWLEVGLAGAPVPAAPLPPTIAVGLGIFLGVVGVLFALVISAYLMRMAMADWRTPPVPEILWFSTFMLVLATLALEWARAGARRRHLPAVQAGLIAGGAFGLAFLGGQVLAWQQLSAAGYYLTTNPANSFFYLITGLHGLHILGGLLALGRAARRVWGGAADDKIRLSVELSAIYWLFMLFVWLILFGLVAGWAGDFIALCQQLLT